MNIEHETDEEGNHHVSVTNEEGDIIHGKGTTLSFAMRTLADNLEKEEQK